MGQMGYENRMGHIGHGTLGVDPWPISFLTLWLGNGNISCQSVMHVQLYMWLTKLQVHVHIQVHASKAAAGTRVINYTGNDLLPDGYPGSEYLICRIYLIGFSELDQ